MFTRASNSMSITELIPPLILVTIRKSCIVCKLCPTLSMDVMSLCILWQAGLKHMCHCKFMGKYVCDYKTAQLKHWHICRDGWWRHIHSQSGIKFSDLKWVWFSQPGWGEIKPVLGYSRNLRHPKCIFSQKFGNSQAWGLSWKNGNSKNCQNLRIPIYLFICLEND